MKHVEEYKRKHDEVLVKVAANLEGLVRSHLSSCVRIDRISVRAKSPSSFEAKALSRRDDGSSRYENPLEQIQDQLGVRVVVFYKSDVERIANELTKYFRAIESRDRFVESEWEFGYAGKHLVLICPRDAMPVDVDEDQVPEFFELQIKTLFEHAWSEANHDLGYKAGNPLTAEQNRILAFTAAQSWGADKLFSDLLQETTGEA